MDNISPGHFKIVNATPHDIPLIIQFIKELAEFEKLSGEVTTDEQTLKESLFGDTRTAETIIGYYDERPVAFAVFFHNFSTFLGRPGLYLEDLFVKSEMRGKGIGKAMLVHLAQLAVARRCGRFEWWVLDWNASAIKFYESLGAVPMNQWTVFRLTGEALTKLAQES
jgi:GNAT superfamily N-acetyltransferase